MFLSKNKIGKEVRKTEWQTSVMKRIFQFTQFNWKYVNTILPMLLMAPINVLDMWIAETVWQHFFNKCTLRWRFHVRSRFARYYLLHLSFELQKQELRACFSIGIWPNKIVSSESNGIVSINRFTIIDFNHAFGYCDLPLPFGWFNVKIVWLFDIIPTFNLYFDYNGLILCNNNNGYI